MSTASTSVPVPWARLRAWVDEHEAMDLGALSSQGGLSVAQLEAISLLVPFLNPPGASDADYVSLLNLSAQKKQLATPFYQDAEPVNVPIAGKMQPGWSYTCTVSAIEGRFPRQGYGIDQGGVAPVFETKKQAKQYAAKHALEYIRQHRTPPPPPPQGKPKKQSASADIQESETGVVESYAMQADRPPANTITADRSPVRKKARQSPRQAHVSRDFPIPAAQAEREDSVMAEEPIPEPRPAPSQVLSEIERLCRALYMNPPTYKISDDIDIAGFFTARPQLAVSARACPPPDFRVVRAKTREAARELAARDVLDWLQTEQRKADFLKMSLLEKHAPTAQVED